MFTYINHFLFVVKEVLISPYLNKFRQYDIIIFNNIDISKYNYKKSM